MAVRARPRRDSQGIVETNVLTSTSFHLRRHASANDECLSSHCGPWSLTRATTVEFHDLCRPAFFTDSDDSRFSQLTKPCASASEQARTSSEDPAAQTSAIGCAYIESGQQDPPPCVVSARRGCCRGARERRALDSGSRVEARHSNDDRPDDGVVTTQNVLCFRVTDGGG